MFSANGKDKDTSSEEETNFSASPLPQDLEMFILDELLSFRELLKLAAYRLFTSSAYNFLWEHKYKKHFSHLYNEKKLTQEIQEIQKIEMNWFEEFIEDFLSEYSIFQNNTNLREQQSITVSDIEELFSLVKESDVQSLEKLDFLKDENTLKESFLFIFNIRDKSGNSLIAYALKINNPHVLNFLYEVVKKYFSLLAMDSCKQTFLDWAFIFKRSCDEIFEIVNVDVSVTQTTYENLLIKAIENSRADIVSHCLELTSQSNNITKNYLTLLSEPMQTAVSCGNVEIIKILLGAEPKLIDVKNDGIILTTTKNAIEEMQFLLEKKPIPIDDWEICNETVLIVTARLGHLECVNFLLTQENIDINGAFQAALISNQLEIAIVIAEAEIKNPACSGEYSEEQLQELLKGKLNLILYNAVERDNSKIVEELINRFPKLINSKNCFSFEKLLMIAVKDNRVKIAEYLLKQSNIEVCPQTLSHACIKDNAIHSAMNLNHKEIINLFISLKSEDFKKIFKFQCDSFINNILFLFSQIKLSEEKNISYSESLSLSVSGLFSTPNKKSNHPQKIIALVDQIKLINKNQNLTYPKKIQMIFQHICETYNEMQHDILKNKLESSGMNKQLHEIILELNRSNYVSLSIAPSKIKFIKLNYWLNEGEKLFVDAADVVDAELEENENERPTITTTVSMNKR